MKVAIFGASGFTGATLVERLAARGDCEIVACIHNSGNAWRLARFGIALTAVDLLELETVKAAIAGCTHVVNCARGDDRTMLVGLKHMLAASHEAKIRHFVHLSSVMVYGDPPNPASIDEAAPTAPLAGTYGWTKLKQDEMVEASARAGLPATVLCPPNIAGPYSHYLQSLVGAVRNRSLAIVDGGHAPCVVVDVSNLCHAIELALDQQTGDGKRMFVTDGATLDWKSVLTLLEPLAGEGTIAHLRSVTRAELELELAPPPTPVKSIRHSLKHLVSSEVRAALRLDPLLRSIDIGVRQGVARMGRGVEDRLRLSIEGALKISPPSPLAGIDLRLSGHQLRETIHSTRRITDVLGYVPLVTPPESMAAFHRWYAKHHGMNDEFSDLTSQLA